MAQSETLKISLIHSTPIPSPETERFRAKEDTHALGSHEIYNLEDKESKKF